MADMTVEEFENPEQLPGSSEMSEAEEKTAEANAEEANKAVEEQQKAEDGEEKSHPEVIKSSRSSENAAEVAGTNPEAEKKFGVEGNKHTVVGDVNEKNEFIDPKASLQNTVNTDATPHRRPKLDKSTASAVIAADPNDPAINNQGHNTTRTNQPGESTPASFPRQAPPTTTAEMRGEVPGKDGKIHKVVQG